MKKKLILIVAALLLVFNTAVAACYLISRTNSDYTTDHYLVFVGLNDKDTGTQLISYEEAVAKIDAAALKYTDGYTIASGDGRWLDDSGAVVTEHSVVCYFDRIPRETVHQIMDEIITELNQSCVFICESKEFAEYYYGG